MGALMDGIVSGSINIFIMLFFIILIGGIVGGLWWWNKQKKKYDVTCLIFEKTGSSIRYDIDIGGIFVDKVTNNKRFYLKRTRVGLEADRVPIINGGKGKVVLLYRFGLKNFKFIELDFDNNLPTITVGEEDVNWAINSYDYVKKTFGKWDFAKVTSTIIFIVVVLGIIIVLYQLFNKFDVLVQVAQALKDASANLKEIEIARNATTVIKSVPTIIT